MISSRLVKTAKQSRKELPGDRSTMLIVGERLMRAGSEGNLLRSTPIQHQELQEHSLKVIAKQGKDSYLRHSTSHLKQNSSLHKSFRI
ncbi:sickle tail protein homolog isoform X1 [Tachysurus ichikawai]